MRRRHSMVRFREGHFPAGVWRCERNRPGAEQAPRSGRIWPTTGRHLVTTDDRSSRAWGFEKRDLSRFHRILSTRHSGFVVQICHLWSEKVTDVLMRPMAINCAPIASNWSILQYMSAKPRATATPTFSTSTPTFLTSTPTFLTSPRVRSCTACGV